MLDARELRILVRVQLLVRRGGRAGVGAGGALDQAGDLGVAEAVAGLGRIATIAARNGGWVLLDDQGKELLRVAKGANGASLFTRRRIFE